MAKMKPPHRSVQAIELLCELRTYMRDCQALGSSSTTEVAQVRFQHTHRFERIDRQERELLYLRERPFCRVKVVIDTYLVG